MTVAAHPSCVRPGQAMTVIIVGPPRGTFSAVVTYTDGEFRGDMMGGDADQNGRFEWPVLVPPDIPPGMGKVAVSMFGQTGAGTADSSFVIAGDQGCG